MTPCSQAAITSRALDSKFAQGLPASDPPSLTQRFGDAAGAAARSTPKKAPTRLGRQVRGAASAARA